MFISLLVDARRRVVIQRFGGAISAADILEARDQIVAHPDFRNDFDSILDVTQVETVIATSAELAELVRTTPLGRDSRVAMVASTELAFGLSRLSATHAEVSGREARVFRDMSEAMAWLGVPDGG